MNKCSTIIYRQITIVYLFFIEKF